MKIRPAEECAWDLVSLGEVMLRLDPGEMRIHTARRFEVWEGGGEYNVARGLRRCFGMRTAIVTALPENPVGRLVEGLIDAGGVDARHVKWVPFDGVGRDVRVGLNFTERGFGPRAAKGVSDRGLSAASQMRPGEADWDRIFGEEGARWLHTGGIFAALSPSTAEAAEEAMAAAKRHGVVVSYDLNYRSSLWKSIGGIEAAQRVNRALAPWVDVMIGNEEDFTACLGFEVEGMREGLMTAEAEAFAAMAQRVQKEFPNIQAVATTMRAAHNATENDWSAILSIGDTACQSRPRPRSLILDRVGGGDSFASGLIYGFLTGRDPQWCVECGAAHGALAMTTPGDTSMATLDEVLAAMRQDGARIDR
jgi:2-dehydro-3-deoxygluconokinase